METKETSLPLGRLTYDIRAPLEYSLYGIGCFFFALAAGLTYLQRPLSISLPVTFFSALSFLCYYKKAVNCAYRLVPEKKKIRYERSIFGWDLGYELCTYEEVVLIGVTCHRRGRERVGRKVFEVFHEYAIVVVTSDGHVVKLSDGSRDATVLSMRAKELAGLCDAPYLPPRENYRIVLQWKDGRAVGSYEQFSWQQSLFGYGEIIFYTLLGALSGAGLYWLFGQ